jgi:hypothetical protein
MNEPFPAGTRFLVGIILEARTFQEARDEARRIVGEEAQVSHVFGRISPNGSASAPQVIDPRGTLEDPVL